MEVKRREFLAQPAALAALAMLPLLMRAYARTEKPLG